LKPGEGRRIKPLSIAKYWLYVVDEKAVERRAGGDQHHALNGAGHLGIPEIIDPRNEEQTSIKY
jgi:hypothetical protein